MKACFLTPDIIANAIGVKKEFLWYIANHREDFYYPARKVIVKNKVRLLEVPKNNLKKILQKLYKYLQKEFPPHKYAFGGVKGKSSFDSADIHKGKEFFITRDIKDCYPSINEKSIYMALIGLQFRMDTASLLSRLFTFHEHIPQGSPISPYALNLYFYSFDQKISSIVGQHNACYGRYADDIIVSLNDKEKIKYFEDLLDAELKKQNLSINEKKRADHGLQIRSQCTPLVHNISVHREKGTTIAKEQKTQSLTIGESYVRSARCVNADSFHKVIAKRQKLHGWISHCGQAHYGPAAHLKKLLKHGDNHVLRILKKNKLSCKENKWWIPKNHDYLQKVWEQRIK